MTTHIQFAQQLFGSHPPRLSPDILLPSPGAGELFLLHGPSGCGKTRALNRLQGQHLKPLPDGQSALSCFPLQLEHERVLKLLAKVGLADATMWSRQTCTLSAGEQRRLQIALLLATNAGPQIIDEPDAHLDVSTARVIAQVLSRQRSRGIIVATHRPELAAYFKPDRIFEINDSGLIEQQIPPAKSITNELTLREGRKRDYAAFAHWHYLGGGLGPVDRVFIAEHQGRPIGIAVFGFPHLHLKSRENVLPEACHSRSIKREGASFLNANVRLLQRIIVHPRYRGIGIAVRLLQHSLQNLGKPYVECLAQMGPFSGFLEGAGFKHIGEVDPPNTVKRLREYMRRNQIKPEDLFQDNLPEHAKRLLKSFVTRRIQTGSGAGRRSGHISQSTIKLAIQRINARPAYYLWMQP